MDAVLKTLFYPLEQNLILPANQKGACAFLNAQVCPGLEKIQPSTLLLQQYFKPYAAALHERGLNVCSEITAKDESYDLVLAALPKNSNEAQYITAQALRILKTGGTFLGAAANNAGGTRIKKMLQQFAQENIHDFSKNKTRVCWTIKTAALNDMAQKAIENGKAQAILDGEYISTPGIFGWDKIDKGSELLLQHICEPLIGKGADFGCGYGHLSRYVLQKNPDITNLSCIDADYRAIEMCRENLKQHSAVQIRYFWEDLTLPLPGLRDLNFIVMNPPFHEGKKTDTKIGTAFIKTAVYSLIPGGKLWMVANVNLPYEDILANSFSSCEKKFEGDGFKVFCATK